MSGDRRDPSSTPQLPLGVQVGLYQILSLLGRGGMGEVYRARDTKLGREVAIKVIAAPLADHPDRLERFRREAQMLAALNHPHIGSIHAVEELGGHQALVLELVEGPTLADRMNLGPIPLPEALTIARQIADALDAAHEKGIIHRDLKPANIKIRPDGNVKVLDFGLAKAMTSDSASPLADSPTMASGKTLEGVIIGTAPYMSPEQARGHIVDKRTDVWAFGCVLYEMLTGAPPFSGETLSDTIAAILGREPDWSALPPATPPTIRVLLRRLLDKDRRRRLHDIADARLEIDDAIAGGHESTRAETPVSRVSPWVPWLIAGLAIAAAAAVVWRPRSFDAIRPAQNVEVHRLTDLVGLEEAPAISPDGKTVAFVTTEKGRRQIWVRLLSGGSPLAVTKDPIDHYWPRWSADSGSLIYFTPGAQPGDAGTIWETPALGGATRRLVSAVGGGDLSHDGTRLTYLRFGDGAIELAIASRDGSGSRTVAKFPPAMYWTPKWSFDDTRIAIADDPGGSRFSSELFIVDVASGQAQHQVTDALLQGLCWLRDGSGLIISTARGSTMSYPPTYNLWTWPLDGGQSRQVTFGESSYESPDLAAHGDLVVSRTRDQSDVAKIPVTGAPQDNVRRSVRVTRQTGRIQTVSVSPDESEVVFLNDNGGHANVWIARVATGEMRPLTREFDPQVVVAVPVWSPTGEWIAFLKSLNSNNRAVTMWLARPDGSDARDLGAPGVWVCWAGDGRTLYYSIFENDSYRIEKRSVETNAASLVRDDNAIGCQVGADGTLYYARALLQARGSLDLEVRRARTDTGPSDAIGRVAGSRVPAGAANFHALLSPDGRWLAMPLVDGPTINLWALSTASGQWRQLTDYEGRNVRITRRIAWSRDGRSIYAAVSDVDSDIVMLTGMR